MYEWVEQRWSIENFERHKVEFCFLGHIFCYPGTNKTVEGTLMSVFSQFIVAVVIVYLGNSCHSSMDNNYNNNILVNILYIIIV